MRIAGFLLGFAVVAAGAEIGLRVTAPKATAKAVGERTYGAKHPLHPDRGIFELDEELGFRPVPGGSKYGPYGVLGDEYELEKDPSRERVLLLGDSILERETLLQSIRKVYGEERYEWWNAGVGAYSTPQEVGYYRDHLGHLEPDHVVLFFNMTDYEVTPLDTLDADGELQILNTRRTGMNPWLLRHSHLYRYYVGRSMAPRAIGQVDQSLVEVVEEKLAELRDLTRERGAELTVIVIPPMRSQEMWNDLVRDNHAGTVDRLERLGIRYFTTLEPLEESAAAGEPLGDPPGDLMHPGVELSDRIAAMLEREGFLREAE